MRPATVSADAASGGFDVIDHHTYASVGQYAYEVNITGPDISGTTDVVHDINVAYVDDAEITMTPVTNLTSTDGPRCVPRGVRAAVRLLIGLPSPPRTAIFCRTDQSNRRRTYEF